MLAAGYAKDKARAEQFYEEFKKHFPYTKLTLHQGDIGTPADCKRAVGEVVEQHGRWGPNGCGETAICADPIIPFQD